MSLAPLHPLRRAFFATLLLTLAAPRCLTAAHSEASFPVLLSSLPNPAAPGAAAPQLTRSPDGSLHLIWIEPATAPTTPSPTDHDSSAPPRSSHHHLHHVRTARLDPSSLAWSPPETIATRPSLFLSNLDTPQLAIGSTHRLALWPEESPPPPSPSIHGDHSHTPPATHAGHGTRTFFLSTSPVTASSPEWSPPVPLAPDSPVVEFAAAVPLSDGRILVAWLDGRARSAGGAMQLRSRIHTIPTTDTPVPPSLSPDILLDPRVCDCCPLALTAFPDGSALLAFRDRSDEEVRDIHVARFDPTDGWRSSKLLHADDWRIAGCPVNGPALDSLGPHVATAWFTAAGSRAAVLSSASTDAGARFTQPARLHAATPLGRAAVALFDDGSRLVSWIETDGAAGHIGHRRVAANGILNPILVTASITDARVTGTPRLARLRNATENRPAAALLAHATDSGLATTVIELPAPDILAALDACPTCPEPLPAYRRGYPIRGRITAIDADASTATFVHHGIPGVLPAGTTDIHATPEVLSSIPLDAPLLARLERIAAHWHLLAPRRISPVRHP